MVAVFFTAGVWVPIALNVGGSAVFKAPQPRSCGGGGRRRQRGRKRVVTIFLDNTKL